MSTKFGTKKIKTPDGTVVYYFEGKMHNWDGPAFIPEGIRKDREYYLYGIKYSEAEWKAAKRRWEGLPWYKGAGAQSRF
jgi:hypothetical protein